LSSKDAWNPIIMGGKRKSGRGRRTSGKEVLLELGADSARSKMSFYYK